MQNTLTISVAFGIFLGLVGCEGSTFTSTPPEKGLNAQGSGSPIHDSDTDFDGNSGQDLGFDGDGDSSNGTDRGGVDRGGFDTDNGGSGDEGGLDGDGEADAGNLDIGETSRRKCATDADFIDLDFPAPVENCHDKDRVWSFDNRRCSSVRNPTRFNCNWDGIKNNPQLVGSVRKSGVSKSEAKLVGCGETDGGKTIVWQYIILPDPSAKKIDCKLDDSTIVWTHCSTRDQGLLNRIDGKSQQEQVRICLED